MIEIATFIATNPSAAVSLIAVLLACLMGYLLYSQWEKRTTQSEEVLTGAETRFNYQSKAIEKKLQETRDDLNVHREDMGKATKAISGDMLKIKEKIFELKSDITDQVDQIRKHSNEIQHSLVLANETTKLAMDNLNEKIGRVVALEKQLEVAKADITKHRAWIQTIGENLKIIKSRTETK